MAKMRSSLGKAYGLGSAREGGKAWWTLRVAAIPLALLVLWWVAEMVLHAGADYDDYTMWLRQPVVAVLMILTLVLVFHHLAHGIQEVLEDYVHTEWLKLAAIIAVRSGSVLLAAVGIFSVLRIAI